MKKVNLPFSIKNHFDNDNKEKFLNKPSKRLYRENFEAFSEKDSIPNSIITFQQTETNHKTNNPQKVTTPKNIFSFNQFLDTISSIKDDSKPKIIKKAEINLPDPFINCILAPTEFSLRYNPIYVVEFSKEIFSYLKIIQSNNQPNASFLSFHPNIPKTKRTLLINNLVIIHSQFDLLDETLFLTVNIIDRYLSNSDNKIKNDLEFLLLGITSVLLASKFEEIYSPEIRDFIYITKYLFTKESILHMEEKILSALNYDLLYVNPLVFLERLILISGNEKGKVYYLSKYLLELTLLDEKFYEYSSLLKASSALYLSKRINKIKNPWNNILKTHSGYEESDIIKCAREICGMLNNVNKSVFKSMSIKYSKKKYREVSLM